MRRLRCLLLSRLATWGDWLPEVTEVELPQLPEVTEVKLPQLPEAAEVEPGWFILPFFRLKSGDRDRVRVETGTQGGSWELALAQNWSFRWKLIRVKYWACNMKWYISFLCQEQLSTPKISLQRLLILIRVKEYKISWYWWGKKYDENNSKFREGRSPIFIL